jgi:hypothetical protein
MDTWTMMAFIWLAFGDAVIAFIVGYKLGPERAKRLVIEHIADPVLGERVRPAWGIPSVKDLRRLEAKLDAIDMRGDLDSALSSVKADLSSSTERDLRRLYEDVRGEVRRVEDKVGDATVTIPDAEITKVAASLKQKMRADVDSWVDQVNAHIDERLDAIVGPDVEMDDALTMDVLSDPEVQEAFIDGAVGLGIPESLARAAVNRGPAAIRKLAEKLGLWDAVKEWLE